MEITHDYWRRLFDFPNALVCVNVIIITPNWKLARRYPKPYPGPIRAIKQNKGTVWWCTRHNKLNANQILVNRRRWRTEQETSSSRAEKLEARSTIELYGRWENKASAMPTRSERECLSVFKLIEIYSVTIILQLNLLNTWLRVGEECRRHSAEEWESWYDR